MTSRNTEQSDARISGRAGRRGFVQSVAATGLLSAMPMVWAQSAPKMSGSASSFGVIDVAGNLAITQKVLENYAQANKKSISRLALTRSPAPELAGKIKAMQAANRVDLHLVLTGLDGMAPGLEQGLWQDLTPYESIFGKPSDIYDGGAAQIQEQAKGQGMLISFAPQGILLGYIPQRVAKPPKTPTELLAWAKANPNKFFYARPANSGPARTFTQGLAYLLGDKDPLDPVKGWDKTWAFLKELDNHIEYYPSGTTPTMRELAQGSRDLIPTTMGWDIYPRVQGILPKDAATVALENATFVSDGHFACIPKGLSEDRLAVALDLLKYILQAPQQAMLYADGYFFPGPARKGVSLADAPAESQKILSEYGRLSVYEPLLKSRPVKAPLEPKAMVAMFRAWDEQIGGRKVKT